ncbi:MAG: ferredoxin:thioredoxin reductase [Candidatus Diapherotrites archaeon CG08_land_8_20_14_0_20_34_12]|nr:MAG: ferredoxin:thioredoxin reductase [Candidatus Diapherotrites archaeon CG08_land_8_20_14_0_20_34_12]
MVITFEMEPYEEFAAKNGYKLNPNYDAARAIVKSLIAREQQYGKRYCPCRKLFNEQEKDDQIVCPCVFVHSDIKTSGKCHCGLFYKK